MNILNPLVSLITGCYNGEKFIERAFHSILEQTYSPIELIFVNDGSNDGSLLKAESFIEIFHRKGIELIIIDQHNQGNYSTSGIKQALGKYISILDIDDYLMPESIQVRVSFLEQNETYVAVRTNGYEVYENDLENRTRLFVVDEVEKKREDIFEDLLFGRTNNWAGSYMVRSNILFECYPDRIVPLSRFGQNLQILMPVAYKGKVGFIDKPLMKYIRNETSLTMSHKTFESQIKLYEGFKEIRLSILNKLNINDSQLFQAIDQLYLNFFVDISFDFQRKTEFNFYYAQLIHTTISDKIRFHILNKNIFMELLYRLLNRIH